MKAGRVESGEPHVAHQHDTQWVGGIAEPVGQSLAPGLVTEMRLPFGRVGGGAGHHHLDVSLVVVILMPVRAQPDQLPVEVDANAPAHADDHRLALQGFQTLSKMLDDVLGNQLHPLLGADDGLQLCPPSLELLPALDLLALGGLLEIRIDLRPLGFVQGELGKPTLVVDGHGRAVLDGALDVVDADVVSEHGASGWRPAARWASR